ncbi:PEP-CTERM sorting domain-containing protein [Scytonema sp. UIC 10036]|uniref:choice-of-anchor W domain-containing protein n=1 Tax=Scytonema sp. UIC 10036 TaxID=2304196 RepID=UPI0012DA4893|nr:choice-of-anchor W domain-containing protein [Scytonema sp. UIC 10036]MUG95727.1 PEP-CTERM sorting domain-containing protein [Scytonema sp. UIC 10036]
MIQRTLLLIFGLVTLGLCAAPNPAKALTLSQNPNFTDMDFENLIKQGQFSEKFVAEGRIGDLGGLATYELSINNDIQQGGLPVEQQQYTWVNNQPVDFSLEYTGNSVKYVVGGQTLSSNAFNGLVSDIFIRTFASRNSTVSLSNLVLNGTSIGALDSSSLGIASDVDYLRVSDISTPFVLTGQTKLFWSGTTPPRNSQLAYQFKVGGSSKTSVPEPGTIGAIALIAVAGLGYSRKKQAA